MELQTKPDAAKCVQRAQAWWDRGIIDRTPVTVFVRPERPPRPVPGHHRSLRDRWVDVEYAVDCVEAAVEAGTYLAECFPLCCPNVGPEVCAAAYGAELEFSENTSWSVPCVEDIRDVPSLEPDLDSPYWSVIRHMTDLSIARGAGRWLTALIDLHTNGDLLAALRDPQALALDYAMDFDGVSAACRHITPHAMVFYDDLYRRIAAAGLPCKTWGHAFSLGRMYYVSCDFICMISPAMLAETILPSLIWEIDHLDHSIFHLDGPDALRHLDTLLDIEKLDAVQWTFGAGNGPASNWIDVYRRILRAGKGIEVLAESFEDARAVMDQLPPEGVWLHVAGRYGRGETQAFIDDVCRWSERKR